MNLLFLYLFQTNSPAKSLAQTSPVKQAPENLASDNQENSATPPQKSAPPRQKSAAPRQKSAASQLSANRTLDTTLGVTLLEGRVITSYKTIKL